MLILAMILHAGGHEAQGATCEDAEAVHCIPTSDRLWAT
jgi:hypothetical protein